MTTRARHLFEIPAPALLHGGYLAEVIDLDDPDNLARVKVRVRKRPAGMLLRHRERKRVFPIPVSRIRARRFQPGGTQPARHQRYRRQRK